MKSNFQKLWVDKGYKIPSLKPKEIEDEIKKVNRILHNQNIGTIFLIIFILAAMALSIIGTGNQIKANATFYINTSSSYTHALNQINTSKTFNGTLIRNGIAYGVRDVYAAGILFGNIAFLIFIFFMFLAILLILPTGEYYKENLKYEYALQVAKLKPVPDEQIFRICDHCAENLPHSEFTHRLNLYKTDFVGQRLWMKYTEAKKEIELQLKDKK